MLRRVKKYIQDHNLLAQGDTVLVAISGGADSIALCDVLQRAGYKLIIAHCNFKLRHEESDRDEYFVRQYAEAHNITLYVKHFNTRAYANNNNISIEMAARELRYLWFEQIAKQNNCKAIAVAHHQNDQAETVLLNLKRGTGIRGLCGMKPKNDNPTGGDIPIIRPLLCTTREYIEHYLKDIRQLTWVNDSTNNDTNIPRNAVREVVNTFTQAEIEHIAATAEYMQGYVDWIEKQNTTAAEKVQLFEKLRDYHFPETEKIYYALKKGQGGKTFYAPKHKAVIRKGKVVVESLENKGI